MNRFNLSLICILFTLPVAGQFSAFNTYANNTCCKLNSLDDTVFVTSKAMEGHYIAPSIVLLSVDMLYAPLQFSNALAVSLNADEIPGIDRAIIYFDTIEAGVAAKWSDNLNLLSFGLGAAVMLSSPNNKMVMFNNMVMFAEGALLTYGITEVLKSAVSRVRPYAYNTDLPESYRFREDVTSSFPSGHTSSTAYNCFFAAKVLNERFIDDDAIALKSLTWAVAATIPAVTGYLRTAAGKHFYTDVIGGYALGAIIGYGVPALHKKYGNDISVFPIAAPQYYGIGLNFNW